MGRTSLEVIADYLPERLRNAVLLTSPANRSKLSEVRLYNGRGLALVYPSRICFTDTHGRLCSKLADVDLMVTSAEISETVSKLCHYSVHSCQRELRQGFFVIENGIRVGVSGVYSESGVIGDVTSLNFRVAREVKGCAERIVGRVPFGSSLLICGGVNSGKTTVLRDVCRIYGELFKCSLIDERNELSGTVDGVPTCDTGTLTDVIVGLDRAGGIASAIRTLSPYMVFCDEISENSDSQAILSGFGSGVRFTATVHAESFEDLSRRKFISELVSAGVFDYAVFLTGSDSPSSVREIRRLAKSA